MFHRSAFKAAASFSEASWRFDGEAAAPIDTAIDGGGEDRGPRHWRDEELFEIALAIITSGALDA